MRAQEKEWRSSQEIPLLKDYSFQHKTLEKRATEYGGELNLDGEYDWGTPVGREVWCE